MGVLPETDVLLKRDDIPGGTGTRTVTRATRVAAAAEPGLWEAILTPFRKAGPWAVLVLLMVVGIGYEAHLLIQGAGQNVSEYVVTSGKNVDALMTTAADGAKAHAMLQQALANVLTSSVSTRDQVVVNTEKLEQIQKMLSESIEQLKTNPVGQEVQMAALTRIENALTELIALVRDAPRIEAERLEGLKAKPAVPKGP